MSCDVALNFSQKKLLPNLLMPLEGILKIEFLRNLFMQIQEKVKKSLCQIFFWSSNFLLVGGRCIWSVIGYSVGRWSVVGGCSVFFLSLQFSCGVSSSNLFFFVDNFVYIMMCSVKKVLNNSNNK